MRMMFAAVIVAALLKPPALPPEVECVRVVDGDTIVVEEDGRRVSVRLLGVDTPEVVHPTKGVEPYGPEASAFTKKLLTGKPVRLVEDTVSAPYDRFRRRLAWVFLADGTCVNEELVRLGCGRAYTEFKVDPILETKLQLLEADAKANRRGLWGLGG